MDHDDTKHSHPARVVAEDVASALVAHFRGRSSEDARTVVSFWLASERGAERAARQLIDFASALGVDVNASPNRNGERS